MACFCTGGSCDSPPAPAGGAGDLVVGCTAAQNVATGKVTITFP